MLKILQDRLQQYVNQMFKLVLEKEEKFSSVQSLSPVQLFATHEL